MALNQGAKNRHSKLIRMLHTFDTEIIEYLICSIIFLLKVTDFHFYNKA